MVKAVGNKISVTIYVKPETFEEMDRSRGSLKMSAYTAMVLDEVFGTGEMIQNPFTH
jgi:hypothetical protein